MVQCSTIHYLLPQYKTSHLNKSDLSKYTAYTLLYVDYTTLRYTIPHALNIHSSYQHLRTYLNRITLYSFHTHFRFLFQLNARQPT